MIKYSLLGVDPKGNPLSIKCAYGFKVSRDTRNLYGKGAWLNSEIFPFKYYLKTIWL